MRRKLNWFEYKDEEENIRLNMDRILKRSLLGIGLLFVIMTTATFVISYFGAPIIMSANEIGDSFGMANALFSALAFAFLIYTSLLQREELKLQRQEIKNNREELKKAAEAQNRMVELTEIMNSGSLYPLLHVYFIGPASKSDNLFDIKLINRSDQWLKFRDVRDADGQIISNHVTSELSPGEDTVIPIDKRKIVRNKDYIVYYHNYQYMFFRYLGPGEKLTTTGRVNRIYKHNIE